jgi:nicotinate-nucleotide adenylyltransferase
MPAREPPHKPLGAHTEAPTRVAMARAAARADERFEVSEIELSRPGPSYTIDTLRALHGESPDAELFVIIGVDQYRELDTWRCPAEIAEYAILAVMDRGGASARSEHPAVVVSGDFPAQRVAFVPVERIDVSSTEVRDRVAAGADVASLVPAGVLEIIEREGLYA